MIDIVSCLFLSLVRFLSMAEQGLSQWEKTLHMEDVTYVTSSLIGLDLAQP